MNRDNEELLLALLGVWFDKHAKEKDCYSRNKVGLYLKTTLKKLGHWKNKGRGNPSAGKAAQPEGAFKPKYKTDKPIKDFFEE